MHPIIAKTLGGLSKAYYARQFAFGLIFPAMIILMESNTETGVSAGTIAFTVISSLLYPYSRFVYESIIDFVMGNNVFFVNAIMMLLVKLITMMVCWVFAIFIAPIGLLYLYYRHSQLENSQ
ncbi:hypothetical protein [Oceanisphaera sp. W20_SRM_FM3]|uniref:hypothetical protein n=1 Tax=Oceanisphaera sp. W20_SRM_FM3 TaxID=3240267 RepID=UPI003F9E2D1A